jgi:polyhydroxybutyrate depolymerase
MLMPMRTRPVILVLLLAMAAALVAAVPAAAGTPAAVDAASRGCKRQATPGVTTQHVTVDGTDREYLLSVPTDYSPKRPAPLIFDFHGLGSDMHEQATYSRLDEQAGARGYVVITPDGQGEPTQRWSLVRAAGANPDVAFVQAMLTATNRALCIDARRVYATGISNGAMFSTVLACALPGRLAAIAPVAGVNATKVCDPGTPPVSVLAFHGTADPIVPYQGGDYFSGAAAARTPGRPQAQPVDDAIAAWAAFDGCGTPPTTRFVADDVQRVAFPKCPKDGTVELYRVVGGGHTWPGSPAVRTSRLGSTTASIDATSLMLDFFAAHPRHAATSKR